MRGTGGLIEMCLEADVRAASACNSSAKQPPDMIRIFTWEDKPSYCGAARARIIDADV